MLIWKTNIKVTARDLEGNILEVKKIKNLLTTVGLNMVRDALFDVGTIADCEIKAMEYGSGSTPPALTDTALETYQGRKAPMVANTRPANGKVKSVFYISPSDYVGWIKELSWWAGADCNGEASGVMFSRVLYSRNKTALESIQIERIDTIKELIE